MGSNSVEAAEKGGKEVQLAVLAATCSTAIVFFPVALLTGVRKYLFTALALTVVIALLRHTRYYGSFGHYCCFSPGVIVAQLRDCLGRTGFGPKARALSRCGLFVRDNARCRASSLTPCS